MGAPHMSALEALKKARAVGIRLDIDGEDLMLQAPAPPPPNVVEALSIHKTDIVALLRPTKDGWSAEDWLTSIAVCPDLRPRQAHMKPA
jgi:hypothetical protein